MSNAAAACSLGRELAGGRELWLPMPAALSQHVTLLGVTGAGKTTTAELLADAAASASMATLVVDAKGGGLRQITRRIAERHGLEHRELVIPGGNRGYNPCALGSNAQVADKLVSAFAHGPSAEIFRVIAQEAIAILVGLLRALGETVTIGRLAEELDRTRMPGLAHRGRECAPELAADLLDLSRRHGIVADALEGMRARLGALRHGEYGELFVEGRQPFDLGRCLQPGVVSYIGLPALAVTKDTALMARVLIQDLKQAAYLRLATSDITPALLVLDEFAALDDPEQIGDLLRQAREARIATVVSTQHLPLAHGLRAALLGAGCLIVHRCGPDDARAISAVIGTETAVEVTRQLEHGRVTGRVTTRIVERPRISASRLSEFATGEAAVLLCVGRRRHAQIAVRRS